MDEGGRTRCADGAPPPASAARIAAGSLGGIVATLVLQPDWLRAAVEALAAREGLAAREVAAAQEALENDIQTAQAAAADAEARAKDLEAAGADAAKTATEAREALEAQGQLPYLSPTEAASWLEGGRRQIGCVSAPWLSAASRIDCESCPMPPSW